MTSLKCHAVVCLDSGGGRATDVHRCCRRPFCCRSLCSLSPEKLQQPRVGTQPLQRHSSSLILFARTSGTNHTDRFIRQHDTPTPSEPFLAQGAIQNAKRTSQRRVADTLAQKHSRTWAFGDAAYNLPKRNECFVSFSATRSSSSKLRRNRNAQCSNPPDRRTDLRGGER